MVVGAAGSVGCGGLNPGAAVSTPGSGASRDEGAGEISADAGGGESERPGAATGGVGEGERPGAATGGAGECAFGNSPTAALRYDVEGDDGGEGGIICAMITQTTAS